MPKIRDLGINVIPATMRPPAVGPGGGFDMQQDVGYQFGCGVPCTDNSPAAEPGCAPCTDNTPAVRCAPCTDNTPAQCAPCTDNTPAQCAPCTDNTPAPRKARGLSDDAVAQLRGQLVSYMVSEPEIN